MVGDSKLGIRTISSVSNVRASTTCNSDVCCRIENSINIPMSGYAHHTPDIPL